MGNLNNVEYGAEHVQSYSTVYPASLSTEAIEKPVTLLCRFKQIFSIAALVLKMIENVGQKPRTQVLGKGRAKARNGLKSEEAAQLSVSAPQDALGLSEIRLLEAQHQSHGLHTRFGAQQHILSCI